MVSSRLTTAVPAHRSAGSTSTGFHPSAQCQRIEECDIHPREISCTTCDQGQIVPSCHGGDLRIGHGIRASAPVCTGAADVIEVRASRTLFASSPPARRVLATAFIDPASHKATVISTRQDPVATVLVRSRTKRAVDPSFVNCSVIPQSLSETLPVCIRPAIGDQTLPTVSDGCGTADRRVVSPVFFVSAFRVRFEFMCRHQIEGLARYGTIVSNEPGSSLS